MSGLLDQHPSRCQALGASASAKATNFGFASNPKINRTPCSFHRSSCAVWLKSVSPRTVTRPDTGLTNPIARSIQATLSLWLAALPSRFTRYSTSRVLAKLTISGA